MSAAEAPVRRELASRVHPERTFSGGAFHGRSLPGRVLAAFVAHELRMQLRSLRFRAVAGGWVAASSLPAVVVSVRQHGSEPASGASFLGETLPWLVPLTVVACFIVAADALVREREQETWSTLSLCALSSGGYVLRRWLALLPPLVAASLVPLLVAGTLATAAGEPVAWSAYAWSWLLRVAPLVLLWSAIGLGFGTAGGGLFAGAGLTALSTYLLLVPLDAVLFRWRLHLGAPPIGLPPLFQSLDRIVDSFGETSGAFDLPFPLPSSDAPLDVAVLAEQVRGSLGSTAMLAALGMAWAILLLRRTRPDLRPWTVREGHSLGTFIRVVGRLRDRFAVDAGLAPRDRAAVAAAVACALAATGAALARDARMVRHGEERYAMEGETWPEVTPRELISVAARLSGEIESGGLVRTESTLELRNDGAAPVGRLALVLAEPLSLARLASPGHEVRWRRRGSRIAVTVTPPVAAGATLRLRASASGRPGHVVLALRASREYGSYLGFQRAYARYHWARFARELPDLGPSFTRPAISPTRVELAAWELMPVPRHTPFGLAGGDQYDGPFPRQEEVLPAVPLAVDLRLPAWLWLADACGTVALEGRLAGGCPVPLSRYVVRGGSYRAERTGGLTVALLPHHHRLAAEKLGGLDHLGEMVREVWPDEDLLSSTVLLEVPADETFLRDGSLAALYRLYGFGAGTPLVAEGRMLVLPEDALLAGEPLSPAAVTARVVGSRLLATREIAGDQQLLFTELVRRFAELRSGFGPATGAVVPATLQGSAPYEVSLLEAEAEAPAVWNLRLPALLVDLGNRIGDDAVRRGLASFLARSGGPPGTLAELVEDWEAAGGVNLDDYYRDFLAGRALPVVELADVGFTAGDEGWRVHGRVVNSGTGTARCTVVLTSDVARTSAEVVVPAGGAATVDFTSTAPPRALLLDPDGRCHRYRALVPPPVERVDYRGSGA